MLVEYLKQYALPSFIISYTAFFIYWIWIYTTGEQDGFHNYFWNVFPQGELRLLVFTLQPQFQRPLNRIFRMLAETLGKGKRQIRPAQGPAKKPHQVQMRDIPHPPLLGKGQINLYFHIFNGILTRREILLTIDPCYFSSS